MYGWVAVEGEPIPLKEAYTHDDARTMNRVVATLHLRSPGAVLGAIWPNTRGRVGKTSEAGCLSMPEISISVSGSMNGVQRGPMPGTACTERDFVTRLGTVRVRVARTR